MKFIHEIFKTNAKKYGSCIAVEDSYSGYTATYRQLYNDIMKAASGLQALNIEKGIHIAQFSENSSKWLVVDQGIFNNAAINILRGSLAPIAELEYIYNHSDSQALVTDSLKVIDGLSHLLDSARFVIYIGNEKIQKNYNFKIETFDSLLALGENKEFQPVEIKGEDVASLIYTSGTTGNPKGAMLTQYNLASQIEGCNAALDLKETKTLTAVLPIWHAYERTCEYYIFSIGSHVCYTNVKNFKKDLKRYRPHYLIAVPRLYEAVYDGIQSELRKKPQFAQNIINAIISASSKREIARRILEGTCIYNQNPTFIQKLCSQIISLSLSPIDALGKFVIYKKFKEAMGGRCVTGIAGGGAMAKHIEDFFKAVGIQVCVGYGLTETSPVLSVRRQSNCKAYSSGPAFKDTQFMIVDTETMKPLNKGEKGLVLVKGPQIMKGYYKNPEATAKVKLANGYLNTGDIGWLTEDNYLVLTGRAKDIIVLSNGENIEPEAIEQSCMTSPFVKQVVIAGQDKNALSALIVPNMEAINEIAQKRHITNPLNNSQLKNEILKELRTKVQNRETFRSHERLANFDFVEEEFTPQNGMMTMTAKIKKNVVYEKYKEKIDAMYK
ncbi:MAG: AMP-binding protein [Candidatus Gastranaerophilales bacterium]|nr:AMP-binding protein [Candidatus Gastranaerophilales bacterium]